MRAYTVATAAVALRVSNKWVDNVLSRYSLHGVTQSRQGIARRLTVEAVIVLEIALRLGRSLEIPLATSLRIARALAAHGRAGDEFPGTLIHLTVDLEAVRATVAARLADAVESTPVPRRGRPRQQ